MVDEKICVPEFVVNISNNILIEINKSGKVLFVNDKAKCVFGGINIGKNLKSYLNDNDWFILYKNMDTVLYNQHQHHFYWDYKNRFYIVYMYPQDFTVWISFEDISEKRQLSHLLHINSLRNAFGEKIAKSGYWELDLTKKRFYWSLGMYRLFELEENYIGNRRNLIRELILPQDMGIYKKELKKLLKHKQNISGFIRILTGKHKIKKCRFGAGIFYENGEEKIAGVFVDIDDCMSEKCEKCAYLSESFNCMMAKIVHDLRQPISAMELLIKDIEGDVEENNKNSLIQLKKAYENLNYMIEGTLHLAKNNEIECEKFNVKDVVIKICDEFLKKIENKDIELIVKLRDFEVCQNLFLTQKIIRNLLDNAVKFTKSKILIKNIGNCLVVGDNGCGIDKNNKNHTVRRFCETNGLACEKAQGTGFGLEIVSYSVRQIGAKMFLRSCKNKYTVFKVCL